jgi:hypothetical protein
LRLICYPISGEPPEILAALVERAWMDGTPTRFANRCLPLKIANAHGWVILNTLPFSATWNGDSSNDAITILPCGAEAKLLARSHFGFGVLTFSVNAVFRTEPGYDLMVTGPMNQLKDGIQALCGVVETDWAPFTFTMNWKFTRKDTHVSFERGEPFCLIFPVKRGLLEQVEPEIRPMEENKELLEAYTTFARSRKKFHQDNGSFVSEVRYRDWQKHYFQGVTHFGVRGQDHRTKIKLKNFTRYTKAQ